jgi:ribokinase
MGIISVIGSLNMDLVVSAERIPNSGETIAGIDFQLIPGGKGANQAIASSRFGAETSMVGCVGKDSFGSILLESLKNSSVSTKNIKCIDEISTGTATIIVEKNGENRIIVVPGANGLVSPEYVDSVWTEISRSSIILLQHEIPIDTISIIVGRAASKGITVILNPAPYYPISDNILSLIDVIILNETEGSALSGLSISNKETAIEAARKMLDKGVRLVILTLGNQGSVLVSHEEEIFQPAFKVQPVDTTAAGDTFVGVYAASVLDCKSKKEALLYATAAAGLTVTKKGAQPSIPTYKEVFEFINNQN